MNNIYRNVYCGEVTSEYVGKEGVFSKIIADFLRKTKV